ncbi:MAG: SIR2 family protein [Humidesulfovibrio sp.]|uniref:SIR2 family protein n=1 Tax=Humidesulfovibrio sp. TaxID=2910988 RepID=UPI0027E9E496|nr:SIR2 family protein [Humidesulfovibrio sp.]MDQ7836801.1 SIR2 family protein [Humidesulfovibrio sp.]
MAKPIDFITKLEAKVRQQLKSQRVGYLLGAGSSYLNGEGYPLAVNLWDQIKDSITDVSRRADIQAKLDEGANGIEHALDLLDDGGAEDTPYRHLVTTALAKLFMSKAPPSTLHCEFVRRIAERAKPSVNVFSLNYDPLIERAASQAKVRLVDGFLGAEQSYFEAAVFEEPIGHYRFSRKGQVFSPKPQVIYLHKLHGSLGWYECPTNGVRRCPFSTDPPLSTKRLMIPPQRRKAADTMFQPYSALWSLFRGCLGQSSDLINRLVCIGYGFADAHVNDIIIPALARSNFSVLIFTKTLTDPAWKFWSAKTNVVVVTETRCSLKGQLGPGHPDLWSFERLAQEV